MDINTLSKKLKDVFKNKKNNNIFILILIGILLIIISNFFKASPASSTKVNSNSQKGGDEVVYDSTYEAALKNELQKTLEKMDGVGKVNVMIYFESGEEQVPATDIDTSKTVTNEKDNAGGVRDTTVDNNGNKIVLSQDNGKSEPFVIKVNKPKVTGICVVAEGAENEVTELTIKQAVMSLFDISADKVNVYPMKK